MRIDGVMVGTKYFGGFSFSCSASYQHRNQKDAKYNGSVFFFFPFMKPLAVFTNNRSLIRMEISTSFSENISS